MARCWRRVVWGGVVLALTGSLSLWLAFRAHAKSEADAAAQRLITTTRPPYHGLKSFLPSSKWGRTDVKKRLWLPTTEVPTPPLTILDWTGFYGAHMSEAFGDALSVCPDDYRCRIVSDRAMLNRSKAIIFHLRDMDWDFENIPDQTERSEEQIYILFSFEPPTLSYADLSEADGFFNWTMSYRQGSNAWTPHGEFTKWPTPEEGKTKHEAVVKALKAKDKGVVWFASNCVVSSERELYVQELQKYIDVDVFGKCGPNECPKVGNGSECEGKILNRYKFYIAFENSVCKDYVTEKYFTYLDKYNVLPIVLKRSVAETVVKPKTSFLAADDFSSPKELADHINTLDGNFEAYAAHFDWHKDYKLAAGFKALPYWHFCQLCRKLHRQPPAAKFRRILKHPQKWWYEEGACIERFASQYLLPKTRDSSLHSADNRGHLGHSPTSV